MECLVFVRMDEFGIVSGMNPHRGSAHEEGKLSYAKDRVWMVVCIVAAAVATSTAVVSYVVSQNLTQEVRTLRQDVLMYTLERKTVTLSSSSWEMGLAEARAKLAALEVRILNEGELPLLLQDLADMRDSLAELFSQAGTEGERGWPIVAGKLTKVQQFLESDSRLDAGAEVASVIEDLREAKQIVK